MFKPTASTPRSRWQRQPKVIGCPLLDKLPGEIRNIIFLYCLDDSMKSKKATATGGGWSEATRGENFNIVIHPKWQGRSKMCMDGLGPLPLLFVNKQVYEELSTLVYSMAHQVSIGGYILQHPEEDPSARWACAYSRLEEHPTIQKDTKHVKIILPHIRSDLFRGQWISLNLRNPEKVARSKVWAMIPGLEVFLRKCTALETLKIVITAVQAEVPNLEVILPLYDICGKATTVEFEQPYPSGDNVFFSAGWVRNWKAAWDECLFANERSSEEGKSGEVVAN